MHRQQSRLFQSGDAYLTAGYETFHGFIPECFWDKGVRSLSFYVREAAVPKGMPGISRVTAPERKKDSYSAFRSGSAAGRKESL